LASIALYPDQLLTQMLMASTYPLQIVAASRWLAQGTNKGLYNRARALSRESAKTEAYQNSRCSGKRSRCCARTSNAS
jgi:hypothetical protein